MGKINSKYPITTTEDQGLVIIKPCEVHLTGEGWMRQFRCVVTEAVEKNPTPSPLILIDMSMVEHVASTFLGELIGLSRTLEKRSGQLRLGGIQKSVEVIFAITRLNRSFKLFESLDEAKASFDS